MTAFGPLGFLDPWLLAGLLALPAIWWLLRFTPPRPRRVVFPPTRLLKGLEDSEKTAEHSPWWLTLLRMILAALVILALARPLIHPDREALGGGGGPLLIAVDNGWASASHWDSRRETMNALIDRAERASRPVVIAPTAGARAETLAPMSPDQARETVAGLSPLPHAPRRAAAAERLENDLETGAGYSVVWLSDGIDHGDAAGFADALVRLAGDSGRVRIARAGGDRVPLGLYAGIGDGGALTARIARPQGAPRSGRVDALSSKGDRLGSADFTLAAGDTAASAEFDLPLEIRNQVARVEIDGERSAGAVHLLDRRSHWRRVGILSGVSEEIAQPLLSPLYYVERALSPYAEVTSTDESNLAAAVPELLGRNLSMLVMADIGHVVDNARADIENWVERGGTLVRFAGPRLERSAEGTLLPAPLRRGGRTLGGSLSWNEPQPLAPFDEESPFHGLSVPGDVKVSRQVLAEPASRGEAETWARLQDGTPLVSSAAHGKGRIVLFHVTANSDWSNLPLSGLFVQMLRRITERSAMTPARKQAEGGAADAAGAGADADSPGVLAPLQVLDAFGRLTAPAATVRPVGDGELKETRPGPAHPPGYYGPAGSARALNLIGEDTQLAPLPEMPRQVTVTGYETAQAIQLKPWLLAGAAGVFLADMIAVLLLASGLGAMTGMARRGTAALAIAGAGALLALAAPGAALAQQQRETAVDQRAMEAALETRLAYVVTGDPEIDRASRTGLDGLSRILETRTAVEPGPAVGVDIGTDELAFYPLLYWPVREDAQKLPDATLARVDAYMKQGGMILFDTRDYQQAAPSGGGGSRGPGAEALSRLLGELDIPPLEPVPEEHVLTKSFYLLSNFPGRWDGGALWVEATAESEAARERRSRRADGVSSLLITSNDFAAAWALNDENQPLYPVVPGGDMQREMAYRVGVNIVMYALTGNYKADQVHVPALLERLGQ